MELQLEYIAEDYVPFGYYSIFSEMVHLFSTYAKFSEKTNISYPLPWYAHERVRIRG